jgi:hypothetical protein
MRLALCLALVSLTAGRAGARPSPPASRPVDLPALVDVSKVRQHMRVFTDGEGNHLVVTSNPAAEVLQAFTFFGTAKQLYRQPAMAASSDGSKIGLSIYDPRITTFPGTRFETKGSSATCRCGKRSVALQPLPAAQAQQLLSGAEFRDTFWRREPHLLARDPNGIYYYVDQLEGRAQRVFAGPRGSMKLLRMKNLVADEAGELYITADGRLRLVLDKTSGPPSFRATWIRGAKRQELTVVDVAKPATRLLIYNELGVYSGEKLQRPCDVW